MYAESKSYDIVNHSVLNAERLAVTIAGKTRSLSKAKKTHETLKQLSEKNRTMEESKATRRENRVKFNRWAEEVDRGYNCVNNTLIDLTNPAEACRVMPHPKRPLTVWAKVNTSNSGIRTSGIQSTPGSALANESKDLSGEHVSSVPVVPSPIVSKPTTARMTSSNIVSARDSRAQTASTNRNIPKLNMSTVEPPSPVTYQDNNVGGPAGGNVQIIRTGGFSGLTAK